MLARNPFARFVDSMRRNDRGLTRTYFVTRVSEAAAAAVAQGESRLSGIGFPTTTCDSTNST